MLGVPLDAPHWQKLPLIRFKVRNFIILGTMAARRTDHIYAKTLKLDRSYSSFDADPHETCINIVHQQIPYAWNAQALVQPAARGENCSFHGVSFGEHF